MLEIKMPNFLVMRLCGGVKMVMDIQKYLEKAERFIQSDAERLVRERPDKFEMWLCHLTDAETHTVFDWQAINQVKQEMDNEQNHE